MSEKFSPRLDILPPAQRLQWDELDELPEFFVLYGGTALALHLGHRASVDFDFFADRDMDPDAIYRSLPFLAGSIITQRETNILSCLVDRGDPVKVSFFGDPHIVRIRPPHLCPGNRLKVASLLDIAATKVAVVPQRSQAKDYLDIDALIAAGIDLPRALAAAKLVFGAHFPPTPSLKALTYFGDGDLAALPTDVKRRLLAAGTSVDPSQLPELDLILRNGEPTS